VTLPTRELPAPANWMPTGLEPEPVRAGAADKVRLYARPAASGAPAIEGDRFAATYHRIALGFGARRGKLAWARLGESDILGGSAFAGGFALCDANGKVSFVDATSGELTGQAAFGKPIDACVVQTDGLKKPSKSAKKSLARQIASCMSSSEQELATVQKFLLRELVSSDDDDVTGALVELAESDRTSPFVIGDARAALASRRTGASFMLKSLERHVDWLAGVKHPPPVAPLADALLAMKEKRAAPLLVAHLLDPADTPEDLEHAAAALAVLADKSEAPGLKTFFAMYRGATGLEGQEQIEHATTSVAEALIRLGEGQIVSEAAADSFTSGGVKTRIASLKK
jgi:outer membrane protein assembly factor BamB